MNWKLVNKDPAHQPNSGTYSDWKEQIAKECYNQCVYCAIHEAQFGGIDHYHIDHFKPRSKFPQHEHDILNLFYACPICNRFKSDDWPGDPDLNAVSYIDPSRINYSELFEVRDNFEIEGKFTSSRYILIRLYLNRVQLIFERRETTRRNQEIKLREEVNTLLALVGDTDAQFALTYHKLVLEVYNNLLNLEHKKMEIRPYQLADIRKS